MCVSAVCVYACLWCRVLFFARTHQRSPLKFSHQEMKNEVSKDKDVIRNKHERERESSIGKAVFGRWPTCWLAGREACLVWRPVVLVQM